MFISIADLEIQRLTFQEEYPMGTLLLGEDVRLALPLRASGHAELVREHRGARAVVNDIRFVGKLATQVELRCARCLEPVTRDLVSSFDLLYRPLGVDAGPHERSVGDADLEIGYYEGDGLELEDVLKEQVLLAVPIKAVCREDCRGLCPHCGSNLNAESCNCVQDAPDVRWSALKEIRDKLQS